MDLIDAVGAVPVPVSIDDDGPRPRELAAAVAGGARVLVIQPRAQNPTGASLTAERAARLGRILADADVLVVEDDSVGAVATTELHSLGLAVRSRTIHVRSYSKSHGPDLRLAALGGAAELIAPIVGRRFLGQGWTSRLLQRVLVDLLRGGESRAAVAYARTEYARRRAAVVGLLADAGVPVGGKDGLNIWVPVADEPAALVTLATHGIGASAGRAFTIEPNQPPHLRVTTALVGCDHGPVARALAASARATPRPAPR
jgi:DNA-binding transcriptional MocR family regulator